MPQGRHTHGLLASGRQVLETLFPCLTSRLIAAGAVTGDIARDARWFQGGGCLARPDSGLEGVLLSRPFLEGAVRDEVRRVRNIRMREQSDIESLTSDNGRVSGIRVTGEALSADLVVDCAGRASSSLSWLAALGYDAPAEELVEIGLAYTTRLFRRNPRQLNGDLAVIIPPTPHGKRGGVMLAQESRALERHPDRPLLSGRARRPGGIHRIHPRPPRAVHPRGRARIAAHRRLRRRPIPRQRSTPAIWSSATPFAASTRSTAKACRSPRSRR